MTIIKTGEPSDPNPLGLAVHLRIPIESLRGLLCDAEAKPWAAFVIDVDSARARGFQGFKSPLGEGEPLRFPL